MCVFVISNTNMWAIHELIENETVIVDVAYKYMYNGCRVCRDVHALAWFHSSGIS